MKVIDAARSIGLTTTDGELKGTIDETRVLDVLAELAESQPEHADLFAEAADRVRASRSAGVEIIDVERGLDPDAAPQIQLRYRSEIADLLTDLAIDVGMRTLPAAARA